jgi:KTSC domain
MQRKPVESSNLASVGFDAKTKTLEIEFKGGGVFQYVGDAAEKHFTALMAAPSKGSYFAKEIRKDTSLTVTRVDAKPAA